MEDPIHVPSELEVPEGAYVQAVFALAIYLRPNGTVGTRWKLTGDVPTETAIGALEVAKAGYIKFELDRTDYEPDD